MVQPHLVVDAVFLRGRACSCPEAMSEVFVMKAAESRAIASPLPVPTSSTAFALLTYCRQ